MPLLLHRDPELELDRARLSALEAELVRREGVLRELTADLQRLQTRYLAEIGVLYRELTDLDAAVMQAEIRAGIRPPPSPDDMSDGEPDAPHAGASSCSNPAAPSGDLKRIFRDVAKAIHPDLALDEPARCRRHSLMAEANRAYAERDEDRLRLILRAWERSAEAVPDDAPAAAAERIRRRLAEIEERLAAMAAQEHDLRRSAIARLKLKIDEARAQGWDLFAEMRLQVQREIARASARLARVQKHR